MTTWHDVLEGRATHCVVAGDCREVLRQLPEASVHCVVTSPPYWGLRDYGVEGQLGLEATPEEYVAKLVEVFREVWRVLRDDGTLWLNLGDSYVSAARGSASVETSTLTNPTRQLEISGSPIDKRQRVGASRNRGAVASDHARAPHRGPSYRRDRADVGNVRHRPAPALKPKDLVGIPWRVAFALQADGWYLRSDIIWHKPNPMPESVGDRCTKAHEYVFLLSKRERYFYDGDAIREPIVYGDHPRNGVPDCQPVQAPGQVPHSGITKLRRSGNKHRVLADGGPGDRPADHLGRGVPWTDDGRGRNRRDVWTIATTPFGGAHFAVMPCALAEPCILAGSGRGGVVVDPFCGAGTVGLVARRHGRRFIGIDLSGVNVEMACGRIRDEWKEGRTFQLPDDAPLFAAEAP